MAKRKQWILELAACAALGLSGCAGSTGQNEPPPPPQSGSVATLLKDAPADNVLAFQVDVTGVALTGSSGSASLLNDMQQVELRHLQLSPTLLLQTNSVRAESYSTVRLTFANPRLTVLGAQGNVQKLTSSTTPSVGLSRVTVDVPLSLSLPSSSMVGLMVDFDLQQSIQTDAGGNYVVNPVVRAKLVDASDDSFHAYGRVEALPGSPPNSLDVRVIPGGQLLRLRTDANTRLSSTIGQFSSLRIGSMVELDARFQASGIHLATYITAGAPDPNLRYEGVVTRFRTNGGTTSLEVVIQRSP